MEFWASPDAPREDHPTARRVRHGGQGIDVAGVCVFVWLGCRFNRRKSSSRCRSVRRCAVFLDWSWKACFSAPTVHVGVDSLLFCVLGWPFALRMSALRRSSNVTPCRAHQRACWSAMPPSFFLTVDCCAWYSMMGSAQRGKARLT